MSHPTEETPAESPGRRRFLAWVAGAIVGVVGATLGGLGSVYLFARSATGLGARWFGVARVGDLSPDRPINAQYLEIVPDGWATWRRRRQVWLVGDGTEVTAFDPRCTHLGCPYDWDEGDHVFRCPCHGAVFAVDGTVLEGPAPRPLDRMAVRIEGDAVLVSDTPSSDPIAS